ncbi:MAG: sulfite exporter TauE/SafE family protein [Adhaeribacter sp.]
MTQDLIMMAVALAVSAFGSVVGFGGGVLMVPLLILFFHYPIELAIGSTMAAMVPAALIASFFNYREKNIDYLVASLIQFPAMSGTVLGALLVSFLPVLELEFIFAFFVIILGFLLLSETPGKGQLRRKEGMMYRVNHLPTSFIRRMKQQHLAYRLNASLVILFGFFTGTIAGLFGIGGGFLQTPVMIKVFGMPARIAISTSLFILALTSLTGLLTHFYLGHVVWTRAMPLMTAFALGATLGQYLKKEDQPGPGIQLLIGLGLFLAGLALILHIIVKAGALFQISF